MSSPKVIVQDDKKMITMSKSVPISISSKANPLDNPELALSKSPPKLLQTSLYKTERCRSWISTGMCKYGNKCQFAHGEDELRPVVRHPKYKTQICKTFSRDGFCPYSSRCRFIHPGETHDSKSNSGEYSKDFLDFDPSEQQNGSSPTLMDHLLLSPTMGNNSLFSSSPTQSEGKLSVPRNEDPSNYFSSSLPSFTDNNWLHDPHHISSKNGSSNGASSSPKTNGKKENGANTSNPSTNKKNGGLWGTTSLRQPIPIDGGKSSRRRESISEEQDEDQIFNFFPTSPLNSEFLTSPKNGFYPPTSSPISSISPFNKSTPSPLSPKIFGFSMNSVSPKNTPNGSSSHGNTIHGFDVREKEESQESQEKRRTKSIPVPVTNRKSEGGEQQTSEQQTAGSTPKEGAVGSPNGDGKSRLPIFSSLAN